MRHLYLRLKGFKGIKAGMGLDEIKLQLDVLPNGIIVFDAPTGSGKTTIADNLTPYRVMPFSAGSSYRPSAFSYYPHVSGDAEKEYWFQMDGEIYRSLLLIDSEKRKQEAYLYIQRGDQWETFPGIDGKLESYDRAVESILGSPELFFTAEFKAQNSKQLSDYTKGDMKEILAELLGIDHIKAKGEKARRIKQELAGRVEMLLFEKKRLNDIVSQEAEAKRLEAETINATDTSRKIIEALTASANAIQEQINECDVNISMAAKTEAEKTALLKEIEDAHNKIVLLEKQRSDKDHGYDASLTILKDKKQKAETLISVLPDLRAKAASKTDLEQKAADAREKIPVFEEQHTSLTNQLIALVSIETTIKEKEKSLQKTKMERDNKISAVKVEFERAQKDAAKLETVPCNIDMAGQCRFVKDAVLARESLQGLQEKLAALQTSDSGDTVFLVEIEDLKAQLHGSRDIQEKLTRAKDVLNKHRAELLKVEESIKSVTQALDVLPRAELAESELGNIDADIATVTDDKAASFIQYTGEITQLRDRVVTLEDKVSHIVSDTQWNTKRSNLAADLGYIKGKIEAAQTEIDVKRQTLGAIQEKINQANHARTELESVAARAAYLNDEISQWAILEKGLGNDGLIALTIDDAGPHISALTNALLKISSNGRYSVKIETQGVKADGKNTKETLEILVFDSVANEWKSVKVTSGGQRALIDDAVSKAICIYNKSATGKDLRTIMTDEKDSAFDMELRKEFFQMKREVLKLGGFDQEYCVTHTPELKALADAVIRLEKGKAEVIIR